MHRVVMAEQWAYEDYEREDMEKVEESRRRAKDAGAASYAAYMGHRQILPSFSENPQYHGIWTSNAYFVPGETAARWVRGDEMNEAEYQEQYQWGQVQQARRITAPRHQYYSLRRHLYNNLNQSIAFATAAPELSLIHI